MSAASRRGPPNRLCCIAALVLLTVGLPVAARTPEAREAERRGLAAEVDLLQKKVVSIEGTVERRRGHLRRRLRALYKLSQGGYVRLLLRAETPSELFARRDGVRRVLRRDLGELASIERELGELGEERERLRLLERRRTEAEVATYEALPHRLARKASLYRPVGGPVVGPFGPYRDPATALLLTRDGVALRTRPGEAVRAIAAGRVTTVEVVPGLGLSVVVDHGDGWLSLLGGLSGPRVTVGDRVATGEHLADAARESIELQLSEGGVRLDPSPWLARPR